MRGIRILVIAALALVLAPLAGQQTARANSYPGLVEESWSRTDSGNTYTLTARIAIERTTDWTVGRFRLRLSCTRNGAPNGCDFLFGGTANAYWCSGPSSPTSCVSRVLDDRQDTPEQVWVGTWHGLQPGTAYQVRAVDFRVVFNNGSGPAGVFHSISSLVHRTPAVPGRADSRSEPVFLVHGFDASLSGDGHDCGTQWGAAMSALRTRGWTGTFLTYGYYATDSGCTIEYPGTRDTSIYTIGQDLAWEIYLRYSRNGQSVDVLAHSMGGLVIRAALTGVSRGESGFPPYVYVEDVATLSTPHLGAGFARLCTPIQCQEMRPESGLLGRLAANPQSRQGTDWSLFGSLDDATVAEGSATGMSAGHKVIYHQGVSHDAIRRLESGPEPADHWHHHDPVWRVATFEQPVVTTNALAYWSLW
jgi:Putative serine esterase (DUF676)